MLCCSSTVHAGTSGLHVLVFFAGLLELKLQRAKESLCVVLCLQGGDQDG
jgi:hypothetical protein